MSDPKPLVERFSTKYIIDDRKGKRQFSHNPAWVRSEDYDQLLLDNQRLAQANDRLKEDAADTLNALKSVHCLTTFFMRNRPEI